MRHLTLALCLLSPVAIAELSDVEKMVEASRASRADQAEAPSRGLIPPMDDGMGLQRSAPSAEVPLPVYEPLPTPNTSRAWTPDNSHLEVKPTVTCYKGASGSVVCH